MQCGLAKTVGRRLSATRKWNYPVEMSLCTAHILIIPMSLSYIQRQQTLTLYNVWHLSHTELQPFGTQFPIVVSRFCRMREKNTYKSDKFSNEKCFWRCRIVWTYTNIGFDWCQWQPRVLHIAPILRNAFASSYLFISGVKNVNFGTFNTSTGHFQTWINIFCVSLPSVCTSMAPLFSQPSSAAESHWPIMCRWLIWWAC